MMLEVSLTNPAWWAMLVIVITSYEITRWSMRWLERRWKARGEIDLSWMGRPICWWLALWRSGYSGAPVSGHDFKTSDEKTPPNVHVLKCMRCGHVSVAWDWNSLEHLK